MQINSKSDVFKSWLTEPKNQLYNNSIYEMVGVDSSHTEKKKYSPSFLIGELRNFNFDYYFNDFIRMVENIDYEYNRPRTSSTYVYPPRKWVYPFKQMCGDYNVLIYQNIYSKELITDKEYSFTLLKIILLKELELETKDFSNKISSYNEEFYLNLINGDNGISEYTCDYLFIINMPVETFFLHFVNIFGHEKILKKCAEILLNIYLNINVVLNIFNPNNHYHQPIANHFSHERLCYALSNLSFLDINLLKCNNNHLPIVKTISSGKFKKEFIDFNYIVEQIYCFLGYDIYNNRVKFNINEITPEDAYHFLNKLQSIYSAGYKQNEIKNHFNYENENFMFENPFNYPLKKNWW